MKTIKERAFELVQISTDIEFVAEALVLLQEIANAPEPEPVLVVEVEPGYWSGGHYYDGSKPYIKPSKVWKLPIGTKLYTAPPPPPKLSDERIMELMGFTEEAYHYFAKQMDEFNEEGE